MGLISPTLASAQRCLPWSYILCLTQGCLAQWALSHRHWRRPRVLRPCLTYCPHPQKFSGPMGLISPTLACPEVPRPGPTYCALSPRCLAQWALSHRHWRRPKVPRPWSVCASPKGALPNGPHLTDTGVAQRCFSLVLHTVPHPRCLPNGPYLTDTGVAQRCLALVLHTVPHPRVPCPMGLISPTLALRKGASPWSY